MPLFIPSHEGLGNSIQSFHIYASIEKTFFDTVDVFIHEGKDNDVLAEIWSELIHQYNRPAENIVVRGEHPSQLDYEKSFSMTKRFSNGSDYVLNRDHTKNESEGNMEILHQAEIPYEKANIKWTPKTYNGKKHDVILANGGKYSEPWLKKRYKRWNEVIIALQKKRYSIGSVGVDNEYVYPADNLTGKGIKEIMDRISLCHIVIANDTFWYHFACLIGKPCVVAFTATNIDKNYSDEFHKTATVVTPNLECSPCQGAGNDLWAKQDTWETCDNYKCAIYNPEPIVRSVCEIMSNRTNIILSRDDSVTTFITTTGKRMDLTVECIKSLDGIVNCHNDNFVVISQCEDYRKREKLELLKNDMNGTIDDIIWLDKNRGVSFAVNMGIEIGKFNNSRFINYIQNDIICCDDDYLKIMMDVWEYAHEKYGVRVFSGHCQKPTTDYMLKYKQTHKKEQYEFNGKFLELCFRYHISAQNIFMSVEDWGLFFPISYIDPVDGLKRGLPNDGRGSRLDWWISLDSECSNVEKDIPGICVNGLLEEKDKGVSTWQ